MTSSGQSQWQWHHQFGQWCYFDRAAQQYVLEDGRRFAIRNQQPSRPWVQEAVAAYRLRQSDLERYLRRKFPESEHGRRGFAIEFDVDSYKFQVPRQLQQHELVQEINNLRYPDSE